MKLNEYIFPLSKFNSTKMENSSACSKSHWKIGDCLIDYLKSIHKIQLYHSHRDSVAADISIFSIVYRLISTQKMGGFFCPTFENYFASFKIHPALFST